MAKSPVDTIKKSATPTETEVKAKETVTTDEMETAKRERPGIEHEFQGNHKKALWNDDWSSETKAAIGEVELYAEMMCPRYTRTRDEISAYQMKLANMLDTVCAFKDPASFMSAMNGIFDIVVAHRDDTFHERSLFRGWSFLPVAPQRLMHIENMFNMLLVFANKKEAKEAKYNYEILLRGFMQPEQGERLVAYLKRRAA